MPYFLHKFNSLKRRIAAWALKLTSILSRLPVPFLEVSVKVVPVGTLAEVPAGSCRSVEADGMGVAICNVDGTIYAVDNTCPHAGGPLGEGSLDGELVECPWHGWRYNVRTGERPENPEITVDCFRVQVENDVIHVVLPD